MEYIISVETKKDEALQRMSLLKLHPNAVNEFKNDNIVNISESAGAGLDGILYWASDKEKEIIKKFEEEHNAVVYHVIRSRTTFGELLSMLYVSNWSEEWADDNQNIIDGYPMAYVKNIDDDMCSEFGYISIKSINGGLKRIS